MTTLNSITVLQTEVTHSHLANFITAEQVDIEFEKTDDGKLTHCHDDKHIITIADVLALGYWYKFEFAFDFKDEANPDEYRIAHTQTGNMLINAAQQMVKRLLK